MDEICEIIPSSNKINVHGYLMEQESIRKNAYYWRCEKRKLENCKGRATTTHNLSL